MRTFIGLLRLVRFPNVFTALADILAGFVLIRAAREGINLTLWSGWEELPRLLGASASLYLAGMAFNDIADEKEDTRVRPNRPIPSGQVSRRMALACAFVLTATGLGLAASVGFDALVHAGLLTAAILQYDFRAKGIFILGPVVLGFCRFLNVQLGMSGHADFSPLLRAAEFNAVPWAPALAVGVYAAGLTAFSAQEEEGRQRKAMLLGWILCGGAILFAGISSSPTAWVLLAPLALMIQFLSFKLRRDGTPQSARNLVRFGVMGICVLDAGLILGFAGTQAWPYAAACLGLLVPGFVIAKLLAQREA